MVLNLFLLGERKGKEVIVLKVSVNINLFNNRDKLLGAVVMLEILEYIGELDVVYKYYEDMYSVAMHIWERMIGTVKFIAGNAICLLGERKKKNQPRIAQSVQSNAEKIFIGIVGSNTRKI